MIKKFICLIAAVLLLTQSAYAKDASEYPQKFWDVPKDHWAFICVADLADRGVINGSCLPSLQSLSTWQCG